MRIAISGIGIAGPTLAWWLRQDGHEPVLFEKSPVLRTGGYLIDFWGVGYDITEKMGLLPTLREKGYLIESLREVDRKGKFVSRLDVNSFRELLHGRLISIARADVASTIFQACGGVEARFNCSIEQIIQHPDRVAVRASDGTTADFDLVVGADGLHSQVRSLAFGSESTFEHRLGCHVIAFTLPGYRPRDERTYVSHTEPLRMVARGPLRNDLTLFLFVFRSGLLNGLSPDVHDPREILRHALGDMQWEMPRILERIDQAKDIYFDRVSQIRMDRWSNGRVVLIGDAAACVSLLAGEGTGLAIAEAYTLAGEIHRASGDYKTAFQRFETKLRPLVSRKQKSALRMVNFFAPKSRFHLFLRNLGMKTASIPFMANIFASGFLKDDFQLTD
jgi:2-polyprenyl-6-methoxyphenol hydroxylase-like FAD-dependent oxidoreductase